ncbi:MAG: hypothetical protein PF442_04850 [Desulfobulbaceae bacterium]|jgi:hypothetical protein|nr:hypothetical protein [Desulfobulbaceae bacterium]
MVTYAWDYNWSSDAYHVGALTGDPLIMGTPSLAEIDNWRMYLSEGTLRLEELRTKKTVPVVLWDAIFLTKGGRYKPKNITPLQSRKSQQKLVLYPEYRYGFDGHILEVQA